MSLVCLQAAAHRFLLSTELPAGLGCESLSRCFAGEVLRSQPLTAAAVSDDLVSLSSSVGACDSSPGPGPAPFVSREHVETSLVWCPPPGEVMIAPSAPSRVITRCTTSGPPARAAAARCSARALGLKIAPLPARSGAL